jgi:hypothetical protein
VNLPPVKKLLDQQNLAYGSGHVIPNPKIAAPIMTAIMAPTMPITASTDRILRRTAQQAGSGSPEVLVVAMVRILKRVCGRTCISVATIVDWRSSPSGDAGLSQLLHAPSLHAGAERNAGNATAKTVATCLRKIA